jgi:hypothetical protein
MIQYEADQKSSHAAAPQRTQAGNPGPDGRPPAVFVGRSTRIFSSATKSFAMNPTARTHLRRSRAGPRVLQ